LLLSRHAHSLLFDGFFRWQDVTALSFHPSPTLSNEAYEIVVDNIELVRAATGNEAEEASSPE